MIVNTHSCDICGVHKKEANHWFHGHIVGSGVALIPWSESWSILGELSSLHEGKSDTLTPTAAVDTAAAHLCGIEHALQWAGKHLSKPAEAQKG